MKWIKNTEGKKDAMLTFSLIAFITVVLKLLLGGMVVQCTNKTITLGTIDASIIGAILTPTLGAYVVRRWTDVNTKDQK